MCAACTYVGMRPHRHTLSFLQGRNVRYTHMLLECSAAAALRAAAGPRFTTLFEAATLPPLLSRFLTFMSYLASLVTLLPALSRSSPPPD